MKQVWQGHHITYEDGRKHPPAEWIVDVTKGEHFLITQLQRFKSLSEGAKAAILYELSRMQTRKTKEDK
ncbi:hypothetical protein PX52LOC_03505 [Limnoglobus roseus]|uniref:Uncharacterized protein n=1 Tax=Limnoglobus roseus TaxID=2598579 RepID=A0A5C1AD25_9BACT|nr:hypothetical protein PX52LOC_03505 [Limnoglobus roseus]